MTLEAYHKAINEGFSESEACKIADEAFEQYQMDQAQYAAEMEAQARADAEHWKSECNALQRMVHEARAEIEHKNKMIEQMREALKGASKHFDRNYWNVKNDPDFEDLNEIWSNIEAALAAEGDEKK